MIDNAEITTQNTCRPEINHTDKITRTLKRKSESFYETWKMTGGKIQSTEMEQLSVLKYTFLQTPEICDIPINYMSIRKYLNS